MKREHILPIAIIVLGVLLGVTISAWAGALGKADAEAARTVLLQKELVVIEENNDSLKIDLAQADSARAQQVRLDSIRFAELDQENENLQRTIGALAAQDQANAESIDEALLDLGAVLSLEAMPALRELQTAYQVRIDGLNGQIIGLTGVVTNRESRIVILEGELVEEREDRAAADVLLGGLGVQIGQQAEIIDTQVLEISALRDAVAPGFIKRIFQMPEVVIIGAVIGGGIVYATTR